MSTIRAPRSSVTWRVESLQDGETRFAGRLYSPPEEARNTALVLHLHRAVPSIPAHLPPARRSPTRWPGPEPRSSRSPIRWRRGIVFRRRWK